MRVRLLLWQWCEHEGHVSKHLWAVETNDLFCHSSSSYAKALALVDRSLNIYTTQTERAGDIPTLSKTVVLVDVLVKH